MKWFNQKFISGLIFNGEKFPTEADKKLYMDDKNQMISEDKKEEASEVCYYLLSTYNNGPLYVFVKRAKSKFPILI